MAPPTGAVSATASAAQATVSSWHPTEGHALHPPGTEHRQALERSIPAGHVGEPDDIAGAVSFFLSRGARYVTDQVLYVCGGTSFVAVP